MTLRNVLRNFGFRNSFCLYKICNFALIFLRDFIAMDFKSAWKIVLLGYVKLREVFTLLKRMHFVLFSPKWNDTWEYVIAVSREEAPS